jgi:hypothetical protein
MDTKIIFSAIWIVVMLIYFLGDILRIISGDVVRGLAGRYLNQWMYLAMAVLMLIPIPYGFPDPCAASACQPFGEYHCCEIFRISPCG